VPTRIRALPSLEIEAKKINAENVKVFKDAEDWVVYIDPPYRDLTGYSHSLPRAKVIEIAKKWDRAGALVVISESESIPQLKSWKTQDITRKAVGGAWQVTELLIMNR
jgi:16S rRNA G966 N2-methylase RsmD